MDPDEPSGRHAVADGTRAQPQLPQLGERDHPVLAAGGGGDRPIRPRRARGPRRRASGSVRRASGLLRRASGLLRPKYGRNRPDAVFDVSVRSPHRCDGGARGVTPGERT
jgi:hypothetical protein